MKEYETQNEYRLLYARAEELTRRAENGVPASGTFLTFGEQNAVSSYMRSLRMGERLLLWGGYEDAERKKAFFVPDRLLPITEEDDITYLLQSSFGDPISALELTGSGYKELGNRDWLGAILNLGVERDACGDIRTAGSHTAYMVCDRSVAGLILSDLIRVGKDTVKVREISFYELAELLPEREYEKISDTVPAARLDAVVGALCRLPREKAKNAVLSGAVQKGGEPAQKPDAVVENGDIISVRGYGKFRIVSVDEKNKKGRLRMSALKYK